MGRKTSDGKFIANLLKKKDTPLGRTLSWSYSLIMPRYYIFKNKQRIYNINSSCIAHYQTKIGNEYPCVICNGKIKKFKNPKITRKYL